MKYLRVFHGLSEVAGQAYYSVKGLKDLGVPTTHIVWSRNSFRYDYDISLGIDKNKKNFFFSLPVWIVKIFYYECKILREHKVFHFHFGRSLLFNHDLWIFHKCRKKIFYEFHGSDLRDYRQARKYNKYMPQDENNYGKDYRKRTKKICRYADGIILHDNELIPYLPDKRPSVYVVPLRLDLQKITPVYVSKENKTIKIVHAPTWREGKGSDYLIQAVQALRGKYDLDLILVENKTQEEALELYREADIIVDQLRIGTYGVFAIESMALGKPVIAYITKEMKQSLPEDLPICSANPDTIQKELERLIQDNELRYNLGMQGRAYAEKYHDYRKNAKMLYEIYSGSLKPLLGRAAFEYAASERLTL